MVQPFNRSEALRLYAAGDEPTNAEIDDALALAVRDYRIKSGLAKLRRSRRNPKVTISAAEREVLIEIGVLQNPNETEAERLTNDEAIEKTFGAKNDPTNRQIRQHHH